MKTRLFTTIFLLFLLVLGMQGTMYGQADIVDVPQVYDGSAVGALNRFISGDTTATGERNNPERIYRLARNTIYIVDAVVITDYKLQIIGADQVDPNDGSKPPILMAAILEDGTSPDYFFYLKADASFKNFAGFGHKPDGLHAIERFLEIHNDGIKVEFSNMKFEGFKDHIIWNGGSNCRLFFEDLYVRRQTGPSPFGGAFLWSNTNSDTTIVRNSTFVGFGCYFLVQRHPSNLTLIDHNTFVNCVGNPFFTPMVHNFHVTNNIFKNMHILAQNKRENREGWFDWDRQPSSLISTDTISVHGEDSLKYLNSTRTFEVTNNAYVWDQKVLDLWNTLLPCTAEGWPANDTLIAVPFMNERTRAFFDNDTDFPNMIARDNYNVDPGFTNEIAENVDRYIDYVKAWRLTRKDPESGFFTIDDDGNETLMQFPFPEDLTYSNPQLLTGGIDGYPIGDLNWYPDKKAEWAGVTDIEDENGNSSLPLDYELSQNYPNPFNPSTTISYSVPQAGNVTLKVYDVLGSEVATLVNEVQNQGSYSVKFPSAEMASKLSSGIYFYSLTSGSVSIVKKMMLLK